MKRRTMLQAAGLALAAPRLARAATTTLKFVPSTDLAILDPVVTTSQPTRTHAFMVFDALYGLDAAYRPQLQMLAGAVVDADFRDWTLTLRDGLRFHDGTPVLARDVVASLRRWGKRDALGKLLFAATDELSAPGDQVIRFRMRKRFTLLPDALAKTSPMACIMPERLARMDAMKAVPEIIGSGPFRFLPDQFVPGARVAYERFAGYVPRADGPAQMTAGPKRVHYDRVEWQIIPDGATAQAALQSGEIDWWERPLPDLLATLRADPKIVVEVNEFIGLIGALRFNALHPPFDNPAIRRLVLSAVNQDDFMTAVMGTDHTLWRDHTGVYPFGTAMANDAGMAVFAGRTDWPAIKRDLAAAGYRGEKVVLLASSDTPAENAMDAVLADLLKKMGFTVDVHTSDWGTLVQRRTSRQPTALGGWSCFITAASGDSFVNPAVSFFTRGNGLDGWFGWPTSARLERLTQDWIEAGNLAQRQAICRQIQLQVWQDVPYVPLGQFYLPSAHRRSMTGVRRGFAQFYDVRPA